MSDDHVFDTGKAHKSPAGGIGGLFVKISRVNAPHIIGFEDGFIYHIYSIRERA